jgi:putative restriction endonuclease
MRLERLMTEDPILQRFDQLNVWKRGRHRAPHKPLLVLYALGRWSRGDTSDMPFREVERPLTELLREFGPPRQSDHPEYPFWRLQNDDVWRVQPDSVMKPRKSNSDIRKGELLAHNARGSFSPEVQAALRADPALVGEIATHLLEGHFPESLHADILSAVGLTLGATTTERKKRDPDFRKRVLTAYEYRCAVCGFDVRLGSVSIALDAAHIRWHQAGGPDREGNGLALCVLHHKLFDLGGWQNEGWPAGFVRRRYPGQACSAGEPASRQVEVVGVLAGLDGDLQAGGAPGGVLLRDQVEGPALGGGPGLPKARQLRRSGMLCLPLAYSSTTRLPSDFPVRRSVPGESPGHKELHT